MQRTTEIADLLIPVRLVYTCWIEKGNELQIW